MPSTCSPPAVTDAVEARGDFMVRVRRVQWECDGICSYELVDLAGLPLPPFEAGAHVDVRIEGVGVRQYSLCNDPAERHRYVVAVQRDDHGRGGSRTLHERVRAGDLLRISAPRNRFPLALEAGSFLLIAGGIGITPILSMARTLIREGKPFRLYVCTRSEARTPFRDELQALSTHGQVHFVHDNGEPARGLDLGQLLASPRPGEHVYCCGPVALMDAVARKGAGWDALRFERFGVAPEMEAPAPPGFAVQIRSTGQVIQVQPDRSVLECLRDAGIEVESACEQGICGTCAIGVVSGTPLHRDEVLDASQREAGRLMMICVSRAAQGECLVLDL